MSKYTLTKVYFSMLAITHMSSIPRGFTTWILNNNVIVQLNVSTKIYHVLKNKKEINTFIKNLTLGFKHLLCDKILFVKRSIFCIAMSFMVVFILDIIMGDKLNIIVTWTC